MNKIFAPLLSALFAFMLSGCDLSMNKNKNKDPNTETSKKNQSQKISDQPPVESPPIREDAINLEESAKTKQAEKWQEMNLATSTNDGGESIHFSNPPQKKNSDSINPNELDTNAQEYFADYKPRN